MRDSAPSTKPLRQETALDGLQHHVPVEHERQNRVSKGTEERQDQVPKGSVDGHSGKETRVNKGKGKARGDRHGRGRGKAVQQGAASDGPAGAVVLGSALDAAANEVTSKAGATSDPVCCFQNDHYC